MTQEIWKEVKGFQGLYEVSNLGRIKQLERMRTGKRSNSKMKECIKKVCHHAHGYSTVTLMTNKRFLVHRLVAIAFIPNPNNYAEVNHIDWNKKNNSVENLEWCTRKYNLIHAYQNPIVMINAKSPKKIEAGKKATRNRAMGINVYKDGVFVKYFETAGDCATYFGWKEYSNIYAVMNGKYKQHKGYTFEKVDKAKEALKAIS